jgi:hypothetical protein
MRYRCCITFDLHEIVEPDDVAVTDEEIVDTVRQIACQMITKEGLDLASQIKVEITGTKVKAYMTVNGAPDRSPTFTET